MPHNNSHVRVFVDLEYCYPGMTPEKGRPNETEKRQIVQIGAIVYDLSTGVELNTFNALAWPAYEKTLPPFFVELTKITQEALEKQATDFPAALNAFTSFCKDYPIWTFDKDWGVFAQNCTYFDVPFPFADKPFTRVKPLLSLWGIDAGAYSSGTLYKAAGLQLDGHVHNALHDVRSMAAAVRHFEQLA